MARALRARKESSEMPNRRTPTRLEEVNRLVRSKGGRVKLKTLHRSMHSRLSIEKFAHELFDMGVKIEDDGGIRYVVGDQG